YKFIPGRDGTVSLEAFAQDIYGRGLFYQEDFDVTTITPDRGGKMTSRDGNCWVEFPPKSVYKPMMVRISELENRSNKFYDSLGNVYQVEPGDIPLKEKVWVYLRYPEDDSLPTKLGVYGQSKEGLWIFSGNQLDPSRKTLSTTVSSLNRYTLIRDLEPPLIWDIQPGNGTHLNIRRPLIQVSVKDRLSGIQTEDYISLRLDGHKLIAEYDPERHLVFYQVREPLALGRHTISVWAMDRCGNKAQAESVFWVE
ncbi:MAG: hypothetical protein ONB05_12085, partial [candidate division KSB1 bacterium]|nr:hypothetical protein [candidate division KSB1 bacterium]